MELPVSEQGSNRNGLKRTFRPDSRLVDAFGRHHKYLRISLTERCNFQCVYCLPPEGFPDQALPSDHMQDDEVVRMVQAFAEMGISKVRLTGGEPLLRAGVANIVGQIKKTTNCDVFMTTNGSLLHRQFDALVDAGLDGINLSLDSMDPDRFAKLTGRKQFARVLKSAMQISEAGLRLRINTVVMSDFRDRDAMELIQFAEQCGADEIRFIEFMPLCGSGWTQSGIGRTVELERQLKNDLVLQGPLQGETSHSYVLKGSDTRIGFISSLSKPFCGHCNRIRLSCTGQMLPCLFSKTGVDLLTPMRRGASSLELQALMEQQILQKKRAHGSDEAIAFDKLEDPKNRISGRIHQIGG